ncbi:MAG: dipeptide epimerase [Myxococcales bacterium]|nr:dipeptide epimerase [Myxococcales bacterium]
MKIRRFAFEPLELALREPFGIAGGVTEVAANALVTVELASGVRGHGEAAPLPAYDGQTQAQALAALARVEPLVVGADARRWRALAGELGRRIPESGAARCAVETAVLDALCRAAGLPLSAFFGGAERTLETDMTIPTGSVEAAGPAAARIAAEGYRSIKLKVGGGPVARDVARACAVAHAAPGLGLLFDGNAGLELASARALLDACAEAGVTPVLFEQPLGRDDHAGLAALRAGAPGRPAVPIAADESARSPADVLALARAGAVDVVNVKLMKAGIAEALDVVAVARACGLGLMIGGMVESSLAMSTAACFAAGLGGFVFVDLDTPALLRDEPFRGGFARSGGTLDLAPILAGHGVEPR